jgi:hypothetical protein
MLFFIRLYDADKLRGSDTPACFHAQSFCCLEMEPAAICALPRKQPPLS